MDYNVSTLAMWLLAAIQHNSMPYVQIGLMTYLQVNNLLFLLSFALLPVSQYMSLLFIQICSCLDRIWCFHLNLVSGWIHNFIETLLP